MARTCAGTAAISVPDVAAYLNTSRQFVWDLIARGQLQSFKIGNKSYVTQESVLRLVAEQKAIPVHDEGLQADIAKQRANHMPNGKAPMASIKLRSFPRRNDMESRTRNPGAVNIADAIKRILAADEGELAERLDSIFEYHDFHQRVATIANNRNLLIMLDMLAYCVRVSHVQ